MEGRFFDRYKEQINKLALKFGIAKLYAFRSVLNKEFYSKSDIDLIVKFHSKLLKPEEIVVLVSQ